jgi:hypothetical protein
MELDLFDAWAAHHNFAVSATKLRPYGEGEAAEDDKGGRAPSGKRAV